jgi:signal transduction histidine kinase
MRSTLTSPNTDLWKKLLRRLGHDLRAPLVNLKMGLQIVAQGEELDLCEDLIAEVTRMDNQVENLLDFVRSVEPTRSSVRLDSLVHQALTDLDKPPGVQIETETSSDRSLSLDVDLHLKLLRKLLANALQAVGPKGRIAIRLEEGVDRLTLSMEDSGPGIEPDQREIVFQPGSGKWHTGLGLGLAFCENVVKAHSGEISAGQSVTLGGARLQIDYPFA